MTAPAGRLTSASPALMHHRAWIEGLIEPDLPTLAAGVTAGGLDADDIEERLVADLDETLFELQHDIEHGHDDSSTERRIGRLERRRDALVRKWHSALRAADYRADKLDELAGTADAGTAATAVGRWGLLEDDPKPAALAAFPSADPPFTLPTASRAYVATEISHHVRTWLAAGGRMLLRSETGTAKTGIALQQLASVIPALKAAGSPHRVILAVPTLDLAGEIMTRARKLGISAETLRGRGNPGKADQPCRSLDAVSLARRAGADVRSTVCTSGDSHCAFLDWCSADGYYGQVARARKADLVVCAHAFLFEPLPAGVADNVGYLVIDEDFTGSADTRGEVTLEALSAEAIRRHPVLSDDGQIDPSATAELIDLGASIINTAKACPGGYLDANELRLAGFTSLGDSPARLASLTWRRKVEVQMAPGMPLERRRAAAAAAAVNATLPRIAALAHALGAILSGDPGAEGFVEAVTKETSAGAVSVLVVRGQRRLASWTTDKPILALDATPNVATVKRIIPDVRLAETARAAWSAVTVHQIAGGFGKSTLSRHATRVAELRDLLSVAMIGKASGLAITHKTHIDQLAMPGVSVMHHGSVAGSDQHADVDVAMIVGGLFASPDAVTELAAGRGGGAVKIERARHSTGVAMLADGRAVQIPVMRYADPAVEAAHRALFDSSITQAIGRVRPLQRTAANPAIVYVFANTALPFPVTTVHAWRDVRPDRLVRMVAGGAVWLNGADAAGFRDDLFKSPRSFEHVRGVVSSARAAVAAIVKHDRQPWTRFLYQRRGRGQRVREVIAPAASEAAIKSVIEDRYGELAMWRGLALTPGRQVVPEPVVNDNIWGTGRTSERVPDDVADYMPHAAIIAAAHAQSAWSSPPDG